MANIRKLQAGFDVITVWFLCWATLFASSAASRHFNNDGQQAVGGEAGVQQKLAQHLSAFLPGGHGTHGTRPHPHQWSTCRQERHYPPADLILKQDGAGSCLTQDAVDSWHPREDTQDVVLLLTQVSDVGSFIIRLWCDRQDKKDEKIWSK